MTKATAITIAALLTAITLTIMWWLRAWTQYNTDEASMADAMHTREDNWDSDCT